MTTRKFPTPAEFGAYVCDEVDHLRAEKIAETIGSEG